MGLVLVSRVFPEPQDFDELQAQEDAMAWCLEENDVTFVRTYVSLDRRRMICTYTAPDAEAVRRAQTKAELPFERVWAVAMFHDLVGLPPFDEMRGRSTVVCERTYPTAVPIEAVVAMSVKARSCLEENNVDLIESYVPTDNAGSVCVFATPDAESARRANRTAHLPFDRIWPATVYDAR